jgi:hypothetical protein
MTGPEDVQSIYDAIPVEEKKLVWIQGTTRRFDGYNYFGEHPEVPVDWFDSHSAQPVPKSDPPHELRVSSAAPPRRHQGSNESWRAAADR